MKAIKEFVGSYYFLSNFYEDFQDISVEHSFQSRKCINPQDTDRVLKASTPGEAKKIGRTVSLRGNWEDIKVDVMRECLLKKFSNPTLRKMLLDTGDAHLEEGNDHGDRCWGTVNGEGQNLLGKLLMQIRESYRTERPAAAPRIGEGRQLGQSVPPGMCVDPRRLIGLNPDQSLEQCSVCGGVFSKPVELDHSQEECGLFVHHFGGVVPDTSITL